jgi:hypothetical protein
VAATAPTNAWTVGNHFNSVPSLVTLVDRWNGKAWKVQRSPGPGGSGNFAVLSGVAATSATNAWTVGQTYNGSVHQTVVEHWNGKAWKVQRSPNPSTTVNILNGVAATSTNGWAVGYYQNGSTRLTLIEHSHS